MFDCEKNAFESFSGKGSKDESKINLGLILCRKIFGDILEEEFKDDSQKLELNGDLQIEKNLENLQLQGESKGINAPGSIFSFAGKVHIFILNYGQAGGELLTMVGFGLDKNGMIGNLEAIKATLPLSIIQVISKGSFEASQKNKVNFTLDSKSAQYSLPQGSNKLAANYLVPVSKIKGYLAEKLLREANDLKNQGFQDKLKLQCGEQELENEMLMGTVKHFVWKKGGDVIIKFSVK